MGSTSLSQIPDPRSRRGRQHALAAILGLVSCAILCGARGDTAIAQWAADHHIALMHRLGFTRRPPKLGGIRKRLIALDVTAFEAALTPWAESLLGRSCGHDRLPLEAFSIDVKTARGSSDGLRKAVHLLALVAHESGLTLAQRAVPDGVLDKTNEHKASLRLLTALVLEGRLITGDAMFCQGDLNAQVVGQGGHYLFFVKAHQPTLLRDIEAAFAPSTEGLFPPRQREIRRREMDRATTLDKGHGRRERRTLRATTALNGYLDWPGVAQVGQVESEVTRGGKTSTEVRSFITSVPRARADAESLLRYVRGHWTIENRSHHVRDTTFGEDASQIRKGAGPEVMAAFRNAAIGFLRVTGADNIAAALRRNAAQVNDLFTRLGILKLWRALTLAFFGYNLEPGGSRRRAVRRTILPSVA